MQTIVRRSVWAVVVALGTGLSLGAAGGVSAAEGPANQGLGFHWASSIPGQSSHGEPSSWVGGKLDVNMASVQELSSIQGIGWDRALAIQDYRDQNGPFVSVNELLRVPGIEQHELDAIRNQVTVAK